jgi:hypothetical protein
MNYGAGELWPFKTIAKAARVILHHQHRPSFGALGQSKSMIWIVVGY